MEKFLLHLYNGSGCSHDSMVASWGRPYSNLEHVYYETGVKYVIDLAFCVENIDFLQDDSTVSKIH